MTRTEHLLVILAEECAEVAQRVSKALRFGLDEIEPGQDATNGERICLEYADLAAVFDMLTEAGRLPRVFAKETVFRKYVEGKQEKVERFLRYSAECGTLQPDPSQRTP